MKRGFTILELLVASLLLGMMMTVLTMIFNQSSIAWRTGLAGVADLDQAREGIAEIRYKADNLYDWDSQVLEIKSVFDEAGKVRTRERAIGSLTQEGNDAFSVSWSGSLEKGGYMDANNTWTPSTAGGKNYIVNVRSFGPDRTEDTYDDIGSIPDDPSDW